MKIGIVGARHQLSEDKQPLGGKFILAHGFRRCSPWLQGSIALGM
jgi:hypothetical protein